jgi:hypothetical protein
MARAATRRKASKTPRLNGNKSNATRKRKEKAMKLISALVGTGIGIAGIYGLLHEYTRRNKPEVHYGKNDFQATMSQSHRKEKIQKQLNTLKEEEEKKKQKLKNQDALRVKNLNKKLEKHNPYTKKNYYK